jgi:hypothetical protein
VREQSPASSDDLESAEMDPFLERDKFALLDLLSAQDHEVDGSGWPEWSPPAIETQASEGETAASHSADLYDFDRGERKSEAFEWSVSAETKTTPPALGAAPYFAERGAISSRSVSADYLERARRAAQENGRVVEKQTIIQRLLGRQSITQRAAVGIAASLLLGGIWAIATAIGIQSGPRQAAASPTTGPAPDVDALRSAYLEAVTQLEAGEITPGIASLRRSAEGGYVLAQYRMARMYESGQGVARNLVLARHWTERAAHGGNVRAMHDMGVYLARGEGASLDAAGAFRWFRAAADYGVADSQYNLGVLYAQGRGVNADAKEALFWFLVAGRHGDTNAVDRAVEMATHLSEADVDAIRDRARAFDTQPPNEEANPGNDASSGA